MNNTQLDVMGKSHSVLKNNFIYLLFINPENYFIFKTNLIYIWNF